MLPSLTLKGNEIRVWVIALVAVLILIVGYHLLEEVQIAGSPPSPGWSKHLTVGKGDLNAPVAVDLLPDGTVLVAWPQSQGLQVATVSKTGKLQKTALLSFPAAYDARIVAGDRVYVFWVDSQTKMLHRGLLDIGSLQLRQREVLAAGVPAFTTVADPGTKKAYVLIGTGNGVNVYTNGPRLEQAAGIQIPAVESVDARFDGNGQLHLVASSKGGLFRYDLYYATTPVTAPAPEAETGPAGKVKPGIPKEKVRVAKISTVSTTGSATLGNIRLGLDKTHSYIFFSKETYSRYIPATNVFFLSFPLGKPPATVMTPARLPFAKYPVQTAGRVVVTSIANPSPATEQDSVLKVALSANVFKTRSKTGMEVVAVDFAGGQPKTAYLASKTAGASLQPQIIKKGGDYYLAWLETAGFGQYKVNIAATSAGFRSGLNSILRADLANAALNSLLNLFSVFLALFFIGGSWLPPFLWIFGCYLLAINWAEQNQNRVLGIALVIYLVAKLWSVQNFIYTPAVRSMMPGWMATLPASFLIPALFVVLTGAGIGLLWRQKRFASVPPAMAFFAAVDTFLTLMLYAPYIR